MQPRIVVIAASAALLVGACATESEQTTKSEQTGHLPSSPYTASFATPTGKPEVNEWDDAHGKTIGVENGYEYEILKAWNNQEKLGLNETDIRTFNTYADAFSAMRAGQVDVVVYFRPSSSVVDRVMDDTTAAAKAEQEKARLEKEDAAFDEP